MSSDPRSRRISRLKWGAFALCVALALIGIAISLRSPMLHLYEYEEDLYPSLDGSVTVYVSASLPALAALHGLDLPTDPSAMLDRDKLREQFRGAGVSVSTISTWRRYGRRFVTVRVDARDIRALNAARPFAANRFEFRKTSRGYRVTEYVGQSTNRDVGKVGWKGSELVGFRWHVPSRIIDHNTVTENFLRGNILVWEQPLRKRLAGVPMTLYVEMHSESILYGTLWLFAISAASAVIVVVLVVWLVVKKAKPKRTVRT